MAMSDQPPSQTGSTTKYSINARLRHAAEADLPVISDHAHDMWDERMPSDAVSAETALELATRLTDLATHGHWRAAGQDQRLPDAVWVYRGIIDQRAYTAAFLENSGSITTVLRASEMTHRPMAAYVRKAARSRVNHHE